MKSTRKFIVSTLVICPAVLFVLAAAEKTPEVPFPDGYRSWQHVKSVIAGPGSKSFATEGGKIYHFYANPQAVDGYRSGTFANGATIVRETLKAVAGEGATAGVLTEGPRTALDVMDKDDHLYRETGGWGFETFDSKNARADEKVKAQCYTCHSKQKEHDFVFGSLAVSADAGVPYPEGYRHWHFLHSSMVPANFSAFGKKPCEKPCVSGIFYFYANDKAMDGLRTGSYADGSIIAEEMLEWLSSKEGPRRLVADMVKDSQRYASTGGWGYGNFGDATNKTDQLDEKARDACYQCHVARKDQGYVFSEYRER